MASAGDIIRKRCVELGWSQADLATKMGVSRTAVGQWESGETGPKRSSVRKLAQILGIKPATLDPLTDVNLQFVTTKTTVALPLVALDELSASLDWSPAMRAKCEQIEVDIELGSDLIVTRIVDDSMSNGRDGYMPNDIVIASKSVSPIDGDDVIAITVDNRSVLRQYRERGKDAAGRQVFDLVAINTDYATVTGNSGNHINVLAVVVEHRRRRARSA